MQQPYRKRFRQTAAPVAVVCPQRLYEEGALTKSVQCLFCKQRFKDAAWLAMHVHSHLTSPFPAQCTQCSVVAASEDALVRHILDAHHAITSQCSVCDRSDTEHECTVECLALIGRRISVCWFIGKKPHWYPGTVTRYNAETREHRVEYDDAKEDGSVNNSGCQECLSDRFWKVL